MKIKNILKNIEKVRDKIKRGPADVLLSQKPFADGMYRFSMFMIDYYSRVRKKLKIDFDSFMIVQTTVSHNLYQLRKKKNGGSNYSDLETEWEQKLNMIKDEPVIDIIASYTPDKQSKLTMSSICLVTGLAKETVRRKVFQLSKRNILKVTKKHGVTLGSEYSEIFQAFVPETVLQVSKLVKDWNKIGILKNLISFRI